MNQKDKFRSVVALGILSVIVLVVIVGFTDLFAKFNGTGDGSIRMDSDTGPFPFQTAGPFKVQVIIDPIKPVVGKNHITIRVQDKKGIPVTGAKVRAVAEMAAMGSMSAMFAPADIEETQSGTYTGTFKLGMSGEWPLGVDVETEEHGHGDLTFDMTTSRAGLQLATATPGDIAYYTCSMHPSVKSAIPGTCPICAMDLVPVTKAELQSGTILLDARRRQLIGVTTAKVTRQTIMQTIRAVGNITYDETRLTDVALKVDGWVGKLHANYTGIAVKKGDPLFTLYSPALLAAQEEYLETRRRMNKKLAINSRLLAAAERKLRLWNVSPEQIRNLATNNKALEYLPILSPATGIVVTKNIIEGAAVKSGQSLFRIANLSQIWVEAQIYDYELPLVKVGMAVTVVLPELQDREYNAKVNYIYPFMQGDTRTARIRVTLDNKSGFLKPDMYAQVHLKIELGERLVVPESAVLYAGQSRVAFVDLGEGRIQPRRIKTGVRNSEVIEVLDGLSEGETVITSGNFLIAAEAKLKAGVDQW